MRYRDLVEKYTADNSYLLRHLKDGKFDPYTYWNELRVWFDEHEDYVELLSEITGQEFADADAINEEDPDLFYKLPQDVQEEAAEWVIEWLMRHDPAEAPTHAQVGLQQQKLIPRSTWLLHFTDHPDEVAAEGFKYGVADMNKLALTTYMSNKSFEKQFGGYNFAFLAGSRDSRNAEHDRKYGKHAVMFQNSGVMTFHYADEENQVIFRGEDVDPRDIVVLHHYDDWQVQSRRQTRGGKALYAGDFDRCVAWVQQHFAQYRRYLTLR